MTPLHRHSKLILLLVLLAFAPVLAWSQPALNIVSVPPLPIGAVGNPYSFQFVASGGTGAYLWVTQSGALPTGLNLSVTGALTGSPTTGGSYTFTVQVVSGNQNASATFTVVVTSALTITTANLNGATIGVAYQMQMTASGALGPITWAIDSQPTPPSFLRIDPTTGILSGTPTASGSFGVTIRATDSTTSTVRNYLLAVQAAITILSTSPLPDATVNSSYLYTLLASGGSSPGGVAPNTQTTGAFVWSSQGTLPPGLLLSTAGVISGTPTFPGTYTFTITVTSGNASTSKVFILTVQPGITIITSSLTQARVGTLYQMPLAATGGVGTLFWFLDLAPPFLSIGSATGILTGTPLSTGDFFVVVRVRDSNNNTASRTYPLNVSQNIQILPESLPNGNVGVAYSAALSATGGLTPYRFTALTQTPPGLTMDIFGVITGTPTQVGTFPIRVQATDAVNATAAKDYSITIGAGALRIVTESLIRGTAGTFYNQSIQATGGRSPYAWFVSSGNLPPGLSLDGNGAITGTPTQVGDFAFVIGVRDQDQVNAIKNLTITIGGQFRITTTALPNGTGGIAYNQTIATANGSSPIRFSGVSGNLPTGLSLDSSTGVISGTPTAGGTFTFTIEARDSSGQTAQQLYTVIITITSNPRITTESMPGGTIGLPFNAMVNVVDGTSPFTFTVSAGTLPAGLSINSSTGAIFGSPELAGSSTFTVQVRDATGATDSKQYTIVVASGLSVTTTTLANGMVSSAYSQTLQAAGGTSGRTWSITGGALPGGLTLSAAGVIGGTPTAAGTFTFTVQVRDSQGNTATRQLSIQIVALSLSQFSFNITGQQGPGMQPGIAAMLNAPAPVALTGIVSFTFQSDAGGVTDPALRFTSGPTATFTIAAGSTQAIFSGGSLGLQLGTVAGTITLTARIMAGNIDVTPVPAPTLVIRITRNAPSIQSTTATRNGNTITVEVIGVVTSRELVSADFAFVVRPGSNVGGTTFTVPLGPASTTFFGNPSSVPFGGTFRLTIPFTVDGDATFFTGVSVTLVNSVGRSETTSANF
ncbi:MAG: putative Ig domain-containing protein [Candidatus Solibacter usitatus]|nr:putative Ig domain-containing protein [Candidatus Solibacter usitatus]